MKPLNYTQISNEFIGKMSNYTGAEVKIFIAISRKTIGFHKETDRISYTQLQKMTGLSVTALKSAIKKLIKDQWILQTETKFGYKYDLNIQSEGVSESDTPLSESDTPLSESDSTKETNIKETNIEKKLLYKYNNNELPPEDSLDELNTSSAINKKNNSLSRNINPSKDTPQPGSVDKTNLEIPRRLQPYEKFIKYWSDKENLSTHKPGTKTYLSALKKLYLFSKGRFGKQYTVDEDYARKNKITFADTVKQWSDEEIYEAIDRYSKYLAGGYEQPVYGNPTKSFDAFLFNPNGNKSTSIFLSKAGPGKEPAPKETPLRSDILEKYRLACFKGQALNPSEEAAFTKSVNFIIREEKKYRKLIDKIGITVLTKLQGDKFFNMHIEFLSDKYIEGGFFKPFHIGSPYTWDKYIIWLKQEYGERFDLNPDNKLIEKWKKEKERDDNDPLMKKQREDQEIRNRFDELRGAGAWAIQGI